MTEAVPFCEIPVFAGVTALAAVDDALVVGTESGLMKIMLRW